jgi:hypothetical protein
MSGKQVDLGGSDKHSKAIWNNLMRAVGAEPKDTLTIQGESGIEHPVQALGVDEKYRRVVIIAAEQNPRIAALMQGDIQARMPDSRVLIARPIAFDIASVARNFIEQFGKVEFKLQEFEAIVNNLRAEDGTYPGLKEFVTPLVGPTILAFQKVTLPPLAQIFSAIQQLTLIDWESVANKAKQDASNLSIPLQNFIKLDSMELDRKLGVCPIPLYELSEQDWELFVSGPHLETLQEHLKAFGIYQYFFPAPDHIALGLVERTQATKEIVSEAIQLAPRVGHPLGSPELVNTQSFAEMVEQLRASDFLVEGEYNLSVTEPGKVARAKVKFRPRESFLSKLIARLKLSASLSIKDLI